MAFARIGTADIYYEHIGQGDALAMIMGLGGGGSMWWRQQETFSKWFQVITLDPRGVGRSDGPDEPITMDTMAGDVLGVLDHLGIRAAHFYGLSMGGMVAQHIALEYPHRVKSLVLGATTCGGLHTVPPAEEAMQTLLALPHLPPEEAVPTALSLVLGSASADRQGEIVREIVQHGMDYHLSSGIFTKQIEAISTFDSYDRLGEIKVPTLIIAGKEDKLLPARNSHILASRIPGSRLVEMDKMGHGYIWESEQADEIVLEFLRQQG